MKLTKEHLDKVRDIEGFPIGKDEDIIALSNPPYYTACPNPFINDFIKEHGKAYDEETDDYNREPFAADVSEGKYDPLYKLHPYHTKVPHKAIMRYILHYTEPGDIVFDGFCGTGMTGVAAQMCENPDVDFKFILEKENPNIKWGARKAIISDLSSIATFIASKYNHKLEHEEFSKKTKKILDKCKEECAWMYKTNHVDAKGEIIIGINSEPIKGDINYCAWSDVFICPNCGSEIIFWDVAVDQANGKVNDTMNCTYCKIKLRKTDSEHAKEFYIDSSTNELKVFSKQAPVIINYTVEGKRYEKTPDNDDIDLLNNINKLNILHWYPGDELPDGLNTEQPKKSHGFTNVYHFYTKRNLITLSMFYKLSDGDSDLLFCITKVANQITKRYRYTYMNGCWGAGGGPMSGTLYIPSLSKELNVLQILENAVKLQDVRLRNQLGEIIISTQSGTDLSNCSSNSIDYIFTDPPFGSNINYSEISFIWESWLQVITNNKTEAIINNVQNKGLLEYQNLMTKCFEECYRILKPNRWMTVEFHNSKNSVWNAIQESLLRAGFIVADVRTLDKKHNSFKQVTTNSAVKQDLVISAYKPKESFKQRFLEKAGTEETVWDFVREHLDKLPIVVKKGNLIEKVKEREAFLLFDRMVAYHIMSGIAVPIDAPDFYKGLGDRFIERDGMYFLHDQINEYDNARIISELEDIQFSMFVSDEKSAIAWLYYQLEEPQTYSNIMPKFMKEANAAKYEKMPELSELLEENFLQDEDGRWYIPDPSKSGDIIKLREKRLLKEFDEYLAGKGKLKQFRTEAVRAGFAKLWKNKDYENIVKVGNRLPEIVIQEDDKLLMYYDIALSRVE